MGYSHLSLLCHQQDHGLTLTGISSMDKYYPGTVLGAKEADENRMLELLTQYFQLAAFCMHGGICTSVTLWVGVGVLIITGQ